MKKYYANYNANGTRLSEAITDTNLARIIKTIRDIANGNRASGNGCYWFVTDEYDEEIARGGTMPNGQKFRTL